MLTKKKVFLSLGAGVALFAAASGVWIWKTRGPVLRSIALDLKAGAKARHAEKPFERYLELRYGTPTNPANRQKAFLGFFDPNHLEGLYRMNGYMKPDERQTNIAASAQWIASYRDTMSDAEREGLAAWLQSEEGRASLQHASGLYRSRDVAYRAATEPVIRELMATLASISKQAQ